MRNITGVLILSLISSSAPAQQRLQVVVLEGANAMGSTNRRAPDVLVEVQDENKKPVDGAHVSIILPERGVGGSFLGGETVGTDRTGSDGKVRFAGIRLRSLPGEFPMRIVATRGGQSASTTLTQRVEGGSPESKGFWNGRNIAIVGIAAAGVAGAIAAAVYENDKTSNAGSSFGARPGTPVVSGPR